MCAFLTPRNARYDPVQVLMKMFGLDLDVLEGLIAKWLKKENKRQLFVYGNVRNDWKKRKLPLYGAPY